MIMKTICICGGGSLAHVIAGFLSAKGKVKVNVLTRKPEQWCKNLEIFTCEHTTLYGKVKTVSKDPHEVIPNSDIILLCLPGFAIKEVLLQIKPFLKSYIFVGSVFSSSGFFFEAMNVLDKNIPLWGFQRVPFIARVIDYGHKAHLLGYKDSYNIAVENVSNIEKETFRKYIEYIFARPTHLLNNYLEASITNSNPLLHTARLYSMFHNYEQGIYYSHNLKFYAEWTNEASDILISMDNELFKLLEKLPVDRNYLTPILTHYDSYDANSLTRKIQSIESFKTIYAPMKETPNGWIPEFNSRYFQEDFAFGLKYIYLKAKEYNIQTPTIDKVYHWSKKWL